MRELARVGRTERGVRGGARHVGMGGIRVEHGSRRPRGAITARRLLRSLVTVRYVSYPSVPRRPPPHSCDTPRIHPAPGAPPTVSAESACMTARMELSRLAQGFRQ